MLGANWLLPVKNLGGIVIMELAGKSGSSLGIACELLIMRFDSVGCDREVNT